MRLFSCFFVTFLALHVARALFKTGVAGTHTTTNSTNNDTCLHICFVFQSSKRPPTALIATRVLVSALTQTTTNSTDNDAFLTQFLPRTRVSYETRASFFRERAFRVRCVRTSFKNTGKSHALDPPPLPGHTSLQTLVRALFS